MYRLPTEDRIGRRLRCLPADEGEAAYSLTTRTAGEVVANPDWMAEAVDPLVEVMVERTRPVPAWTSFPPTGYTDRQLALRNSIPRMAIWTSACRKVPLKSWTDSFSCTWHSP
jgi:hypothetical protein